MIRRCLFAALALLGLLSSPVRAAESVWQDFDSLSPYDRGLAESALFERFGDNPEWWPDWLEPKATLVVGRGGRDYLVVREPMHLPCGQWGYTVFGTPDDKGERQKLGRRFCGGDLFVAASGQRLPDLQIEAEGFSTDGLTWTHETARWRWTDGQWWQYAPK